MRHPCSSYAIKIWIMEFKNNYLKEQLVQKKVMHYCFCNKVFIV